MKETLERILLKLSGEALAGDKTTGIDIKVVKDIADKIAAIREYCQVGIVVGGGNFWRGRDDNDIDRATSDYMGMLGTVMNSLALQDALEKLNIPTRVQTSIEMRAVAEPYIRRRAVNQLSKNMVVIFAAGTGSPYFSTDTTAALRAAEIKADAILLAKKGVDGIYDSDPKTNNNAKKYDHLSYMDILKKDLKIMDATATSLCKDNNIPLIVFGIDDPQNIVRAVRGDKIGTVVEEV